MDEILTVEDAHSEILRWFINHNFSPEALFAVLSENDRLSNNSIFDIGNNCANGFGITIIEVELLDAECNAEIGSSERSSECHRLVSVYVWSHLDGLEEIFDYFIDDRYPAGSTNQLNWVNLVLGYACLVDSLLQLLLDGLEYGWLFKDISFDDDIEIDAIGQCLDVHIHFLIGREHFFGIRTFVHQFDPSLIVVAHVDLVLRLKLYCSILRQNLIQGQPTNSRQGYMWEHF